MTAGFKRTQDGSTQRAAPVVVARLIVGALPFHGAAANDNPVPFSLRLRRGWVLIGAIVAFGTLTAIAFS